MQKMILPLVLFCCLSAAAIAVAKNGKEKPARPQSSFDVEMCSLGNGRWTAIRYNRVTGDSAEMQEGAWVKIAAPRNLEDRTGAYRIEMTQTTQGRFAAILFDEDDGDAWHLNDGRWLPIAAQ